MVPGYRRTRKRGQRRAVTTWDASSERTAPASVSGASASVAAARRSPRTGAKGERDLGAEHPLERHRHRLERRALVDGAPDGDAEAAPRPQCAPHLAEGSRAVGEELQPLLAENRVEAGIRQSKIERAALDPLDRCSSRCRERSRDGEHPGVQIDTNDVPTGTDALRRSASHDASPASNIQHALALREPSAIDKQRRPGCEDVSSDVALVQFSGLPGQLPRLVLVHLACHLCYGARVRSRPLRVSSLESTNSVAI